MPATRRTRTSSGPVPKGGQTALSFTPSKVTKPAAKDKEKDHKPTITRDIPIDSLAPPTASVSVPADSLGHVSSEPAVLAQASAAAAAAAAAAKEPSPEEIRAAEVTDAQIRKYWKAREAERRTPRVHLGDVPVEERVLRFWDMSSQYGPAIGISRTRRWHRAHRLGLAPPIEVLAVLVKEEERSRNPKIERAYVDELMSSIAVAGEA